MNISIIGGSGFIGTRLASRLSDGNYSFNIIDKVISQSFPTLTRRADVRSLDDLNGVISDSSILINLAAEHRDDVSPLSLYDDVNVQGAINICAVANSKNITKIIFTSSVAVYGFAPLNTGEDGEISPFNDYGRTKYEAEVIFRKWQIEDFANRTLVIIRPTVVFGEKNRGNVYNLLSQMCKKQFVMVGNGENRKSMAYVENIAAFIEYSLRANPGVHTYNYVDKPDFTMNNLVSHVQNLLGKSPNTNIRIPYFLGIVIGKCFDMASTIFNIKFVISGIRVKKFCSNSVYATNVDNTGFIRPVTLLDAIGNTVKYEFLERHSSDQIFFSE